ncbi:unnamed protein product [Phytophthora lilii]|uniref:Unnamed protein product n=1 Tax=Phytophthora lilii TaxID=2077276 RepID=A0A9W6XJ70_9STRA|nr:unnamed protein product [Phytophthora lilii]
MNWLVLFISYLAFTRSSELPNQGARSLPTLPTLHSTKLATLGLDEVLVPATEPASVLSPLKFTQLTSGVRADEALASSGITPPTGAQPVEAASCSATLGKLLPARTRTSHFSTRSQLNQDSFTYVLAIVDCDKGTNFLVLLFSPMNGKRGQQTEERTHSHNTLLHQRREAARETHARCLEITRRRTTVAAASQSFFDRLASLPIREAIQVRTLLIQFATGVFMPDLAYFSCFSCLRLNAKRF